MKISDGIETIGLESLNLTGATTVINPVLIRDDTTVVQSSIAWGLTGLGSRSLRTAYGKLDRGCLKALLRNPGGV